MSLLVAVSKSAHQFVLPVTRSIRQPTNSDGSTVSYTEKLSKRWSRRLRGKPRRRRPKLYQSDCSGV